MKKEAGKQTLVIVTVDKKGNNVAHYKDAQGNLQSVLTRTQTFNTQ